MDDPVLAPRFGHRPLGRVEDFGRMFGERVDESPGATSGRCRRSIKWRPPAR